KEAAVQSEGSERSGDLVGLAELHLTAAAQGIDPGVQEHRTGADGEANLAARLGEEREPVDKERLVGDQLRAAIGARLVRRMPAGEVSLQHARRCTTAQ